MRYRLEHLGVCDILDESIDVVRDNFKQLFPIFAAMYVPTAIAIGLAMVLVVPQPPLNPTPEQSIEFSRQVFSWLPLFYVLIFAQIFVLAFLTFLIAPAISSAYLGEPTNVRSALRYSLSRSLPLLVVTFVLVVPATIGLACCVFPGFLYFLFFGLAVNVLLIERIGGFNSLARSFQLVRRDWMTGVGLYLIVGVMTYMLSLSQAAVIQPHLRVVVYSVLSAAIHLWFMAVLTVFYYSCRCESECFDLYYLANTIVPRPDPETDNDAGLPFSAT